MNASILNKAIPEEVFLRWSTKCVKNIWSNPITIKWELARRILMSDISTTLQHGALSQGIDLRKPTLFIATITYNWTQRSSSLRRLITSIRLHHMDNQIRCKRSTNKAKHCRQLIWILCEDGSTLNDEVAALLNCSEIPHVYFAYGPTKKHGNSQRNAILEYIVNLTHIFYFTASVHPVDDDCYTLPEAFNLAYNVKKVALIPVVGLGPEGIEYAVPDNKSMAKEVRANWLTRKFPVDYNGLAWSSTIFDRMWRQGQRLYWPFTGYGGETEFLQLYLKELKEIYVPCNKCKTVFYNRPIQDTDILFNCPLFNRHASNLID